VNRTDIGVLKWLLFLGGAALSIWALKTPFVPGMLLMGLIWPIIFILWRALNRAGHGAPPVISAGAVGADDPVPGLPRLEGDGSFSLAIVGESRYRGNLEQVCGRRTRKGHNVETLAVLVLEEDNRHDPMAVRIDIKGQTVGHLSRDKARRYRELLSAAGLAHPEAVCRARIRGGWYRGPDGAGDFGVQLDVNLARKRPTRAQQSQTEVPMKPIIVLAVVLLSLLAAPGAHAVEPDPVVFISQQLCIYGVTYGEAFAMSLVPGAVTMNVDQLGACRHPVPVCAPVELVKQTRKKTIVRYRNLKYVLKGDWIGSTFGTSNECAGLPATPAQVPAPAPTE
jgi:HIRAN domain-containing protein